MTGTLRNLSFFLDTVRTIFASEDNAMETIKGIDALKRAETLSKVGGSFSISFFPFSRKKKAAETDARLETFQGCTMRLPLPHDRFDIDGKHFFLFTTQDEKPRTCYRVLIRFIGFSDENFKLYRVLWYE